MAIGVLNHKECGGHVAIDTSNVLKLVAPSFRLGINGLHGLTLDSKLKDDGKFIPEFECQKCGHKFEKDQMPSQVTSQCLICQETYEIEHVYVHNHIPCICTRCKDETLSYIKTKETGDKRIAHFAGLYNINSRNFKVARLSDVIFSPISL